MCPWNARFPAELAGALPRVAGAGRYDAVEWPADKDGGPALPSLGGPDLVEFTERILAVSGKEYRRVFSESPLARGFLTHVPIAPRSVAKTTASLNRWDTSHQPSTRNTRTAGYGLIPSSPQSHRAVSGRPGAVQYGLFRVSGEVQNVPGVRG